MIKNETIHKHIKRSSRSSKWFEYSKALVKGELVVPRKEPFNKLGYRESIQSDLEEFSANPNSINGLSINGRRHSYR
jgi:hypothetical protein